MPVKMHFTLDSQSRKVLGNLLRAIMPLGEWIADRKKSGGYEPPDTHDPLKFPWRNGGPALSTDKLGVVDFIQMLIRESANEVLLLGRWKMLESDALRFCPIENKDEWRAARGLDDDVRFGPALSENAPGSLSKPPIARTELYAEYLPLLCQVASARRLADDDRAGWTTFMLELFKDQCRQWPKLQSHPPSRFMFQLLRDLLYAVLGMRNAIAEPWHSAVLAEIGEFRRPGNTYDREDVARGLTEFQRVLAEVTDKPRDLAEPDRLPATTYDHYLQFESVFDPKRGDK
jgi:hypothetical protein